MPVNRLLRCTVKKWGNVFVINLEGIASLGEVSTYISKCGNI
jgi:hypothetical protein